MIKPRKEDREFIGVLPKNQAIIDKIRRDGYYAVLFNNADFMDAVVWAANLTYDFQDFLSGYENKTVISQLELLVRKDDLYNAHIIMIIYYRMKKNIILMEECKLNLMNLARFQLIPEEHLSIVQDWVAAIMQSESAREAGAYQTSIISSLKATESIYKNYEKIVDEEMKRYKVELEKL